MRYKYFSFSIFFIGCIALLSVSLYSQDSTAWFGIRAGASFPVGDYAATTLDGGSFALTGYNVTAEGVYYFLPRFGAGLSFGLNQHPVDVGLLGWERVQQDPFLEDVYIRSEPYLMLTGMAGLYYRQPVYKKIGFNAHLLGGMLYGKTPWQLHRQQFFMIGERDGIITSAIDWKPAINAGLGIRYPVTSCFGLVLESHITYSELAFSFISSGVTTFDRRTILFINSTLGLQLDF